MKMTKLAFCLLALGLSLAAESIIKDGEKVAFLGDSITQQGSRNTGGYVNLMMAVLKANGVNAELIAAGVSGNKSDAMLKRLDKDVLSKKPTFLFVNGGVNDVNHKPGIPLEEYRKNIAEIVSRAQAAGIRVCLLTPTVLSENLKDKRNEALLAYVEAMKQIGVEKECLVADLHADFRAELLARQARFPKIRGTKLTYDGTHMNSAGNRVMARSALKAIGFTDEEIAKAADVWNKGTAPATGGLQLTAEQIDILSQMASDSKTSIADCIVRILSESLKKN